MFKYFEHEGRDWPKTAVKWEEIKPQPYENPVTDFESALEYLKEDEWWVWDCDGGNTNTYFVGIKNEKETRYYEVEHEFWAQWEPAFQVHNYFTVKEIDKEKAHIPDDRNWLDLRQKSYPEIKKWPPKNGL